VCCFAGIHSNISVCIPIGVRLCTPTLFTLDSKPLRDSPFYTNTLLTAQAPESLILPAFNAD
jgi:hypothetical protein